MRVILLLLLGLALLISCAHATGLDGHKVVVIPADKAVYVNGVCYNLKAFPDTQDGVRAARWDGSSGIVETDRGEKPVGEGFFRPYVDAWQAAHRAFSSAAEESGQINGVQQPPLVVRLCRARLALDALRAEEAFAAQDAPDNTSVLSFLAMAVKEARANLDALRDEMKRGKR